MERLEQGSGVFGSLRKKVKKAIKTGPLKTFQTFKRSVERKKQGALVFDIADMRSDMLTSIISPGPRSGSLSPLVESFSEFSQMGGRAYACMSPDDDLDIRQLSNSRCSTTTPAASPDLWAGSNVSMISRPGTRQDVRHNDMKIFEAADFARQEVDESEFVDMVVREKVKADYWGSHKDAESAKNVISDWEEYMRKLHDELGDEEILDKDLISSFSGFTRKTDQEEVISAYAKQCQKNYYRPLGPRSRRALQGSCTPHMTTPEMFQYRGWSLGSDRLDMILDTSGEGLHGCRHCNLSGNRIKDRSLPILCSQLLPTVETLDLSNNMFTAEGARNLANGFIGCKNLPARAPLLELNLEENRLGEGKEEDVCLLVENIGAFCPQLRGLSLAKNNLGISKHDAKRADHESGGCVGGAIGRFVASASNLRVLDLHWNQFGGVGAYQLLTGIYDNGQQSDGKLSRVDLSWNRLGLVDSAHKNAIPAKVLADVLEDHKHLFHLDISYNQLGVEACEFIAAGIKDNHTLFGIHIAGNAASVDANGFIFPHKSPGSINPPLVSRDALSFLPEENIKKVSRKHLGRFGSSGCVTNKQSMARRKCTNFIETDHGISTDADQHAIDLAGNIGSHSLDYLHLRAECCWICDRWRPTRLVWTPGVSGTLLGDDIQGVYAFLSIDGFRRPMPLQRKAANNTTVSRETWEGHFMMPPHSKSVPLLAIFQINDSLALAADMPKRDLAEPVCIKVTTGGKQALNIVSIRSCNDDERCKMRCGRKAIASKDSLGTCCEGCASGKEHSDDCIAENDGFMYTANELPPVIRGEPPPDSINRKQPLVVTEDLVEHGKLLVLPRAVNLEDAKIVKKWTRAVSVWASWTEEMHTHLEKMLLFDLQLAKTSKICAASDKDLKKVILPFYSMLVSAYRVLSLQASGTGFQVFGMGLTTFVALCNKCELLDEAFASKDLSSFTVASGVVEKRLMQTVRVRDEKINIRYQFLETLLRIAHAKYVVPNHVASLGKGMELLLHDMAGHLSDHRTDLENFRKVYFVEEVDMVYKVYFHLLRAVYDHYCSINHRPASMGALGLPFWCEFLHDCNAFDERFVRRKASTAFLYGLMWQIDEVSNERHMHMTFVEFLVGIGAMIYMRMFWHKDEFADLLEEFLEDNLVPAMEEKLAAENEKISSLLGKSHNESARPVALSKKQLEKAFHMVFEIADEDDDGVLTLREFRNAFRNPKVVHVLGGKSCNAEDFGRVFDSLDGDHNHQLTVEEAMAGFDSFRRLELTSERAHAYFSNFCDELLHVIDGNVRRADFVRALKQPSVVRKLMRLSIDPDHVWQFLNQPSLENKDAFEADWLVAELLKLRSAKVIPRWKIAVRQIFQAADQNNNGIVSKSEWKKMADSHSIVSKLEKCGIPRPMIDPMFDLLDVDGDNDLTLQELMHGIEIVLERGAASLPGQLDDGSPGKVQTQKSTSLAQKSRQNQPNNSAHKAASGQK